MFNIIDGADLWHGQEGNTFFQALEKGKKAQREILALYPHLYVPVDSTCAPDAGS